MYEKNGETTTNKEEMYSRAKDKMVHPVYLLFVDETGCNTNQKDDGHVGGKLFVLPTKEQGEGSVSGAVTDIHFTVLCLMNVCSYINVEHKC
jgi:hypothetical protein